MSVKIIGAVSAVEADVDASRNVMTSEGLPAIGASGGHYTVTGGPAGIVAAALATDTSLFSCRMGASGRKAYITKFRFIMSPATLGAAAGVAGSIGLQRITAAAPSGGTARTANRQAASSGTTPDLASIMDLASALTVTSVVFGTELARTRVPLFVASAGGFEWIYEPIYPTVLENGDGIVLRTRVALAATQTWVFDYTMHWYEK